MYNVLNKEGERVKVMSINPQIHRHLSGREFDENDACLKKEPVAKVTEKGQVQKLTKAEWMEELSKGTDLAEVVHTESSTDVKVNLDMTEEQLAEKNMDYAIRAYIEKYGKKPHHKAKLETIIAKL